MGNVFTNPGDVWPSIFRISQPHRSTCGIFTVSGQPGVCSFAYFSHALGLGLRYHTPVGPIRFDASYNLNPPIYPVSYSKNLPITPYIGEASHFNFFFSLGQSF
jgi:outer membrane protein assembly factor BamA